MCPFIFPSACEEQIKFLQMCALVKIILLFPLPEVNWIKDCLWNISLWNTPNLLLVISETNQCPIPRLKKKKKKSISISNLKLKFLIKLISERNSSARNFIPVSGFEGGKWWCTPPLTGAFYQKELVGSDAAGNQITQFLQLQFLQLLACKATRQWWTRHETPSLSLPLSAMQLSFSLRLQSLTRN